MLFQGLRNLIFLKAQVTAPRELVAREQMANEDAGEGSVGLHTVLTSLGGFSGQPSLPQGCVQLSLTPHAEQDGKPFFPAPQFCIQGGRLVVFRVVASCSLAEI